MVKREEPDWQVEPVIEWLVTEGRHLPDIEETVRRLGSKLVAAGAPVWRLRLSVRTLHPLITAISALWERDSGPIGRIESQHGFERKASVAGSPLERIAQTGAPLRKRLTELHQDDHAVFHEMAGRGATDYFGLPLRFAGGGEGILVFVSDAAGGVGEGDLNRFAKLAHHVTPIVEVFRLQRLSLAVAEAYLGARSGQRVLGGQITRGDIEEIEAAILVCDMRDWTGLSSRLSPRDAVALVNRYFDLVAGAVAREGGEILKFIGDGVLAIFEPGTDARDACRRALAAALSMQDEADPPLGARFGIGLHYGQVMYGNIGAADRLDFTVLGQAVNIAARIEGLTGRLDAPVLYSDAFARHLPRPGRTAMRERLKGMDQRITVWRP